MHACLAMRTHLDAAGFRLSLFRARISVLAMECVPGVDRGTPWVARMSFCGQGGSEANRNLGNLPLHETVNNLLVDVVTKLEEIEELE
jgi:hypothetical protein